MHQGLSSTLPAILLVTFVFVPSTATMIFKTFLCDPYVFDYTTTRRYLNDALELSCDSDEYRSTRATALLFLFVWPVGVPVLYAVLLYACRDAIRNRAMTGLSQATSFLWADCTSCLDPNRDLWRLQRIDRGSAYL